MTIHKGQTKIHKTLHRKLKIDQHQPLKNRGELMCSGKVNRCYSISGTRRATHCCKEVQVMIANRTYPRSFMTQIFRNGHGGDTKTNDFKITTVNPWFSGFPVSSNPLWYI